MKRKLEIVIEFDDGPWFDEETEEWRPTNVLAFAMDQVNSFFPYTLGDEDVGFVEARLDGELLVNKNGDASEEVKQLIPQYQVFMEKVARKNS